MGAACCETKVTKQDEDDPFIAEEEALALLLTEVFLQAAAEIEVELDRALTPPVDLRRLEGVIVSAQLLFSSLVTDTVAPQVSDLLMRALLNGSLSAADLPLMVDGATLPSLADADIRLDGSMILGGVPSAVEVHRAAVEMVEYYASTYFDRIIYPAFQAKLEKAIAATPVTEALDADEIKGIFLPSGEMTALYFLILANVAVSRTYHYGYLKTSQLLGRRGYRFVAVMDGKTSEICQEANGREFWIADAVNLLEAAARGGPTAGAQMMPWPEPGTPGILIPPLHPSCRSTLRAI